MINDIRKQIETRIAELNKADADFCKDRWDMSKPKMERELYRGFSNEVTFARQELERLLKFLNELSKADVSGQVCGHSEVDTVEGIIYCKTCKLTLGGGM